MTGEKPTPLNERTIDIDAPGTPGLKLSGPAELPLEEIARWMRHRFGRLMSIASHPRGEVPAHDARRELWTVPAVAQRLRMSKDTVHRMCESGELEGAFRRGPGAHWRIPVEAIEKFLAATRVVRRRR